jgi:hypothetical protein
MALADEAQLVGHDDKDARKRRPSVCQLNAPAAQVRPDWRHGIVSG